MIDKAFMAEAPEIKKLVSKRDISIEAFELVNGNLMLEATFLDTYHLIRLNMHVDPITKEIVFSHSEYVNYPHALCPMVAEKAKNLIGLKVERGVIRKVINKIGGSKGCVHLRELALEAINCTSNVLVGFDEGFGLMNREFQMLNEEKRYEISKNRLKNTCLVYLEEKSI